MPEIDGRPIHFALTDAAREIFESIVISRFSVRDRHDEVLRTDDGLAMIPRGRTRWTLNLARAEILEPALEPVAVSDEDSGAPDIVEVRADWYSPKRARLSRLQVEAADNANIFRELGVIFVPDRFRIPVVTATRENVRHYGLTLIEDRQSFEMQSTEFDMILARYRYALNYRRDFLLEVSGGGGYFVETHDFPHLHVPLNPNCGGFIISGKRLADDCYHFTAFRIPYGCALHTPANAIHGDGTIVGEHAICVATATAEANTVLFYNHNARAMAREIFPLD